MRMCAGIIVDVEICMVVVLNLCGVRFSSAIKKKLQMYVYAGPSAGKILGQKKGAEGIFYLTIFHLKRMLHCVLVL